VHHLDSWIKRDQLDVTCFIISLFTAQHVSDVNTSILRSLRLICWVISWDVLFWFDVCWCYVVVWLGWCGIRMQAEALVKVTSNWSLFIQRFQNLYNLLVSNLLAQLLPNLTSCNVTCGLIRDFVQTDILLWDFAYTETWATKEWRKLRSDIILGEDMNIL